MLVLTRKDGETIHIGDNVYIRVIRTHAGRVRIGIEAPKEVSIARAELFSAEDRDENRMPAGSLATSVSLARQESSIRTLRRPR